MVNILITSISRYFPVFPCISLYFPVFPGIFRYFPVFPCISRHFPVFPGMSRYFPVFPGISWYFRVFPAVPGNKSISRLFTNPGPYVTLYQVLFGNPPNYRSQSPTLIQWSHGTMAKVEKISRPTVDEGISLEDWLDFEQRWREYKDATRVAGRDLIHQLLDCCNPDGLRKNLVRVHRDTLASCSNETYWPTLK